MLSVLKSHTVFLDAARRASLNAGHFEKTRKEHAEQVSRSWSSLGESDITLEDAASTLEHLENSCFDLEQRTMLATVVNTLASKAGSQSMAMAQTRSSTKPQEHLWMHRYLTAQDWNRLRDPTVSFTSKIDAMVERASAIGLVSLTEKTAVAVTAVLLVAHGQSKDAAQTYT
jgi:hypothetical protein